MGFQRIFAKNVQICIHFGVCFGDFNVVCSWYRCWWCQGVKKREGKEEKQLVFEIHTFKGISRLK